MNLRETKGIAFLLSVVVMFVLMGLGLSYLSLVRMETRVSTALDEQQEALYNAESGVHHSLAEIMDNSDADGDGPGNLPPKDIDIDGDMDYSVSYLNNKITSIGTEGRATRTVVVEISTGPWTGALQVGGSITDCVNSGDIITGDVNVFGTIHPNFGGSCFNSANITGNVSEGDTSVTIPTPDFPTWQTVADYTHADCSWLTPTPASGVHYVSGDCVVDFGSPGVPFVLNGSLIVDGALSLQRLNAGVTITASGSNPAIVASGNINLTTFTDVNITGLIYSEGNIVFTSWNLPPPMHHITGAIVSGGNLGFIVSDRLDIVFDTNLNPPYFSGGSGGTPTITLWRGHPE